MSGTSRQLNSRNGAGGRQPVDLGPVFALGAFLIGLVLRYHFILVQNRPSDPENILGDAGWYVYEAVKFFDPDFTPDITNTLFPPGTPFYFGALRWIDPSMQLLNNFQWILACLVPPILGLTAHLLFGRKCGQYVLGFSSLYFPFWEYFGYFISEGPFIFCMFSAFLLLILSLQSITVKESVFWGLFGGLMLGVSAAFKSVSLFSAALVFLALIYGKRKSKVRIWPTLASAAAGLIIVLTPISIRATRLNEGNFLLIANDAPRTFLLGHQGRVGLTWWVDEKRAFHMNFTNPSTTQHSYTEEKSYPFGPYEAAPNYAAGWKWIKENPLETILLSIEHVFDMFALTLPWPGYFRSYAGWTIFFNEVFLVLILLPALVHLLRSGRQMLHADPRYLGDIIVLAAAGSIYIIAFLFLGEGRYRICYDGFMILLAARAFFPITTDGFIFRLPAATEPGGTKVQSEA